jgi:hypothetical protein
MPDKPAKSDAPLKDVEIDVKVKERDGKKPPGHEKHVQKVKEKVEQDVKKAVETAAPGGSDAQFDAAKHAAKTAVKPADEKVVEHVRVSVKGDDADGDSEHRVLKVKPDPAQR